MSVPLLLAPMAGITHSAFRRLISDFGGYTALFTEMLSAKSLMVENLEQSPYTKKRSCEGKVWYQLLISGSEDIHALLDRVKQCTPYALDINCACPAPEIARFKAGIALFRDYDRLATTLTKVRNEWQGLLSVKIRLGDNTPVWEEELLKRVHLFEEIGIDYIIFHPRFSDEKLKRKARWERLSWLADQTKIPIIASGDIGDPLDVIKNEELFSKCAALMIGRMAVVRPWLFALFDNPSLAINYTEVWLRYYTYVMEDFIPGKALGRLKEFTAYYARNFSFGHELFTSTRTCTTCEELCKRTELYLSKLPQIVLRPTVEGL